MNGVKFLQLLFSVVTVGVILLLLRLSRTLRYEKRIDAFSISSISEKEVSLFDRIKSIIWLIVRKNSYILSKSAVLTKYSLGYEKYINFEDREKKEGIDYVSFKFFLTFVVLILSLITFIFHFKTFNVGILLILLLITFFLPDIFLKIEFTKKRKRIEEDLLKAIIIMNNAFQSGRNIMQAIEIVKKELDGPIEDEFKKIYLDITYGLSLDVVFNRFYERVKIEDAKYITTSLTLLNRTGGDIIKIFSMIEKSIFDKKNLKNELNSLTASSRFVFKFLIGLPIFFSLLIFILNPSYFNPFFTTGVGIAIFITIIALYVLYILAIRKILEVKL